MGKLFKLDSCSKECQVKGFWVGLQRGQRSGHGSGLTKGGALRFAVVWLPTSCCSQPSAPLCGLVTLNRKKELGCLHTIQGPSFKPTAARSTGTKALCLLLSQTLLLCEGSGGEKKPLIRVNDHSPALLINAPASCGVKTQLKRLYTS